MKVSFVIPAYNEVDSIAAAIGAVRIFANERYDDYEIIVVDDGSTDGTREIVMKEEDVKLIGDGVNRGKGYAVRAGVLAASGEWIVFLDADLSTKPEEMIKLEKYFHDHDIVIGSRALPDSVLLKRQPRIREWQGRLLNRIIRWYLGIPFYDTQCGFKAFNSRTKILFSALTTYGWMFDVELLVRARKFGYKTKEVGIVWENDEETKVKASHAIQIFMDLRRIKKIV